MKDKEIIWHFCYWDEPCTTKNQTDNTALITNKQTKEDDTTNYTSREEDSDKTKGS
jgi:hypothetical protein